MVISQQSTTSSSSNLTELQVVSLDVHQSKEDWWSHTVMELAFLCCHHAFSIHTSHHQLVVRMCWLPVSCVLCLDKHKDNTTYDKIKWDRLFVAGSPANDASLTRYHRLTLICVFLFVLWMYFLIQMRTKCQNPWEAQTFRNRTIVPVVLLTGSEDHPIDRRDQAGHDVRWLLLFVHKSSVTFCHQWKWLSS